MMDASVILLAWNGMAHLRECLDSLVALNPAAKEIIVVDNASTDGSAEFVRAHYPTVRLIGNRHNLGFAAGMNVGLRAATGNMLVGLNQDTIVSPDWLAEMAVVFQSDQRIAIVGGKALYPGGRIQHAGGVVDARGEGSHLGLNQEDNGSFDRQRDVDYVTGAAIAITRKFYAAIGDLDEQFGPAYFEDVDWCYRARAVGGRVVYAPKAVYVHKEASTAGGGSYQALYEFHRNRLRFVMKHFPMERLCQDFSEAETRWLEQISHFEPHRLSAMQRAYVSVLLRLDSLMMARQAYQTVADGDEEKIGKLLTRLRSFEPAAESHPPMSPPQAPWLPDATASSSNQHAVTVADMIVRPHTFRSTVPFFGPLLAAFRTLWHRMSAEWAIQTILLQQNAINALLFHRLETMSEQLAQLQQLNRQLEQVQLDFRQSQLTRTQSDQRMIELLREQVAESGREIADISSELRARAAPTHPQESAQID